MTISRSSITQEIDLDELATFIHKDRVKNANSWWVGTFDPNASGLEAISTSMRGWVDGTLWRPLKEEIASCCKTRAEYEEGNDPFVWLRHCASLPHVKAVLAKQPLEVLQKEHQYMLENIMKTLREKVVT